MDLRRGLVIFVVIQPVTRPACRRQGQGTSDKGQERREKGEGEKQNIKDE